MNERQTIMSVSQITKKAIAYGLKELMKKKPFEKITIADITEACGLNRQTFYYHFQDKYELVDWIYYHEAISVLMENLSFETWSDRVLEMLTVMQHEAPFYENALKASGQNGFHNYLFSVARELFGDVIDKVAKGSIAEDEKLFIAEFYAYGIVGIIVSWAQQGMKKSPAEITGHLKKLVYDSQKFAISRYIKNEIPES